MPRFALSLLLCSLAIAAPAGAGEPGQLDADVSAIEAAPAARWVASGEPSAGGYRLSLARGELDLGLDFQRRVAAMRAADARLDSAAPPGATLPALSFGLRSVGAPAPASSLVDRTLAAAASPSVSRVGIEYKPAQSQFFLNHGLGFRLSGDDRVTMRLRKGSLGIYMKRTF
ncbi:MAG TPA: hypothetical protein VLD35_09555 [Caldimonas sp.]|nr:hypothetical protein [Caldimonas sp.]